MSDLRPSGELPPDLPPEYAEAYRRGYERAYLEATGTTTGDDEPRRVSGHLFADEDEDPTASHAEPTRSLSWDGARSEDRPQTAADEPLSFFRDGPEHVAPAPLVDNSTAWRDDDLPADDLPADQGRARPAWLVPAVLAALVLMLVVGAFGVGRILASTMGDAEVSASEPEGVELGGAAAGSEAPPKAGATGQAGRGVYQGPVEAVAIAGAMATCQAPSSVDAAGNEIGYPPTSAFDGDLTTAWRCDGTGVGQTLTLTLTQSARIGELGLVPGYAKTDPRSGVDRYAENNRVTRVRWSFDDGSSVVQRLDGSPTNRELQTRRIRPVESSSVVLEVLASVQGPRNTIAVSEVSVNGLPE